VLISTTTADHVDTPTNLGEITAWNLKGYNLPVYKNIDVILTPYLLRWRHFAAHELAQNPKESQTRQN
jgi:hypothetical protein